MVTSMTTLDREELADRIAALSIAQRKKFFRENEVLVQSVLSDFANAFTHKSGARAGKPMVTKISKLLGLSKGGAISDSLRGKRDLPAGARDELFTVWKKVSSMSNPQNAERRGNKIFDSTTGREIR